MIDWIQGEIRLIRISISNPIDLVVCSLNEPLEESSDMTEPATKPFVNGTRRCPTWKANIFQLDSTTPAEVPGVLKVLLELGLWTKFTIRSWQRAFHSELGSFKEQFAWCQHFLNWKLAPASFCPKKKKKKHYYHFGNILSLVFTWTCSFETELVGLEIRYFWYPATMVFSGGGSGGSSSNCIADIFGTLANNIDCGDGGEKDWGGEADDRRLLRGNKALGNSSWSSLTAGGSKRDKIDRREM